MRLFWIIFLTSLRSCEPNLININENELATHDPAVLDEALNTCGRYDMSLPTVLSRGHRDTLMTVLQNAEVESLWSGIVRDTLDVWTWINGVKYNGGGILSEAPHLTCATISGTAAYSSDCFSQAEGYICQQECSRCPENTCHPLPAVGLCFTSYLDKVTWFEAASKCVHKNASLLMFKGDDVKHYLKNSPSKQFWIGLSKGPWYFMQNDKNKMLVDNIWKTGEVTETDKRCSVIQRMRSRLVWIPTKCSERHPYVCLQDPPDIMTTTSVLPSTVYQKIFTTAKPATRSSGTGSDGKVAMTTSFPGRSTLASAANNSGEQDILRWALPLGVALAVLIFLTCFTVLIVCLRKLYGSRQPANPINNQTYQSLTPCQVTYTRGQQNACCDVAYVKGQSVKKDLTEPLYEELKDNAYEKPTYLKTPPAPDITAIPTADEDYLQPQCTGGHVTSTHVQNQNSYETPVAVDVTGMTTKTPGNETKENGGNAVVVMDTPTADESNKTNHPSEGGE